MDQTIAAIATGMGNAGIGVIRVSGAESFSVVSRIFRDHKGRQVDTSAYATHTIHYGSIVTDERKSDGSDVPETVLDQVLLLIMKAPHSYTGENVAEIQCHGGSYILKKILEVVCENGARLAEPGEFTKRAFLNGRMDLSQAEAVMDLIEAQNAFAQRNATSQLEGTLGQKIGSIRADILYHMAYIESALDDPENYSLEGFGDSLYTVVENICEKVDSLLQNADNGRIRKEGIRTVLVGRPNVGKSTLLNALLGEKRALVTHIPGTTRDTLEEQVRFDDVQLILVDTAGIHETDNEIESMGIDRTRKEIETADLVIFLTEADTPLNQDEKEILSLLKDKKTIVLENKCDLVENIDREENSQSTLIMDKESGRLKALSNAPILRISAKEQIGMEKIPEVIREMFRVGDLDWNSEVMVTNLRHKQALERTYEDLQQVLQSIRNDMPEDFYTIDLMDAYQELGTITGETAGEDLINEIFRKFCTGK